jgi:hypothetical protein
MTPYKWSFRQIMFGWSDFKYSLIIWKNLMFTPYNIITTDKFFFYTTMQFWWYDEHFD